MQMNSTKMKLSIARRIVACGNLLHMGIRLFPILLGILGISLLPIGLGLYFSGISPGFGLPFIMIGAIVLGCIVLLGICMLGEYCFQSANAVVHSTTVQSDDPMHTASATQVQEEDPNSSGVSV